MISTTAPNAASKSSPRHARRGQGVARPGHAGASAGASRRERTCVGCGERVPVDRARDEMVRLVLLPAQHGMEVAVDLAGHSSGRGAWVHGRTQCLERAAARGLARPLADGRHSGMAAPRRTARAGSGVHLAPED